MPMEIVFVKYLLLIAPCLAENIALDKPANQTGVYGGATADRAVDGRYDIGDGQYLSVCAHPDISGQLGKPAEWWVDLEDTYSISNVTVWNTYNTGGYWRMNNFTVEVVTSDNTTRQSCGDYIKPDPVSRGGSYTFNCNYKQGRYVYVRRLQWAKEQHLITLCEVNVEGVLITTTTTTTTTNTTTKMTTTTKTTQTTIPSTTVTKTHPHVRVSTITTLSSSTILSSSAKDTKPPGKESVLTTTTDGKKKNKKSVIISISVISILITIVIITAVLICCKKKKKGKLATGYYFSQSTSNDVSSEVAFTSANFVSAFPTGDELEEVHSAEGTSEAHNVADEEDSYRNSLIPVAEFESYINSKKADSETAFDEYTKLPLSESSRCNVAITDDNKKKNRFRNLYPYDNNRVILKEGNPETDGDYINASFIKGYNSTEDTYIATQGPVRETMRDFWRMIWQCNANTIVMVANLVENGRKLCDCYWPERKDQAEKHGEFTVTIQSVAEYADYTIRSLEVSKNDESRSVYQYHFTSWKDKGSPTFGAVTLLNFHRKVHAKDDERTGPLVVHCSAGIGRTGTFIALDILLQQMEHEKAVDIFGCVRKLREQRMLMVQTQEQYVFLHDAILEAITVGNTAYPCSTLAETFKDICEEKNGRSELQKQFKLLCKLKPSTEEQNNDDGVIPENKGKNRDISVLPGNGNRPYLTMTAGCHSDYINAVYVDSFKKHGNYIVTQMPLPNTQADLWRLVYDHQLNSIVMLNELDQSDETCQQYWPDEGTQVYGPMNITHMATAKISANIIMREFMVNMERDKEVRSQSPSKPHNVRHYQLLGWPNNEVLPPDSGSLLSLIEEVQRWQEQHKHTQHSHKMGHILIHCMNGTRHSGLFCGSSHIIDEIKLDNEMNALFAARSVSRSRKQFYETQDEYKFLYEIAIEYLSTSNQFKSIITG